MLVSVIVPVYNERDYIDEFLRSIIQQDFTEYEVIIIDDGSTDGTRDILMEYANQYEQIKVKYVEHAGVSNARNEGIEIASGKYLLFLDSDDFAYPKMIRCLYEEMENKHCDFVVCNVLRQHENQWYEQSEERESYQIELSQYGRENYLRDYIFSEKHKYCLWNKMFRRELIVTYNIRFISNDLIYPEDLLFLFDVILWSRCIAWIPEILYMHYTRTQSITSSYRKYIYERYYHSLLYMKEKIQTPSFLSFVTIDLLCNAFTASIKCNHCNMLENYQELKKHYQTYLKVPDKKCYRTILPRKRIWFHCFLKRKWILFPSMVYYMLIKYKIIKKL